MTVNKITSKDLRDVMLISGTALEIKNPEEQLSSVLDLLERVFKTGNNNFYFACNSGHNLNLNRVISRGIESKFFQEFKQYYHNLDPFYKILSLNSSPTVVVRDHSRNKGKYIEYYNDFLKPQRIHHQMSIYLESKQRFLGVLGLYRPPNASGFSPLEKAKACILAPYLAGALENALIPEQKIKQDAIIDSILTDMPYKGIIVLDEFLEVIYYNKHATCFFPDLTQKNREQGIFSSPLQKEIYLQCKDLLRQISIVEDSRSPQSLFELHNLKSNKKQSIHLRVITCQNNKPLLLLCFTPKKCEQNLLEQVRQYGLSQRQIEVVCLLNKGLTNKEISSRLFISRYTVENHLKAIYEKMDVTNRTEVSYRLQQKSKISYPF